MNLNEHVNVDTIFNQYCDIFTPDDGYALWDDTEIGNLDEETGEPLCYWLQMQIQKSISETQAPHIWAKLIDETMEVFGKTDPNQPEVATFNLRRSSPTAEETSHTYIDENGVEREKRGVY